MAGTNKYARYTFPKQTKEYYDRVLERAKQERRKKLDRLSCRGVAVSDTEWEKGEIPPDEMNEFEGKAKENQVGLPSEEEIAMLARSIRESCWDERTEQERMGVYAPVPADFPKTERLQTSRGVSEDY